MAVRDDRAERGMARTVRRVLLALCVFVALGAFALWRIDNPRVERLRMRVVDALAPSMEWTKDPLTFASEMVSDFERFVAVYEQNEALRREIESLRAWREVAEQREQENARLRALNNVRLAPRAAFVTGEVFADSGGPFLQTALANIGRLDGVTDGAPVMDGSGLVGRVVGLGDHAARILLLTDYSSRVPVRVQPSGLRAIVAGDNTGAPRLEFLETPTDVGAGDRIVTSGDGGVFPPDLAVGRVMVEPDLTARVRPAADLPKLEFVRVLRRTEDSRIDRDGGLVVAPPQAPTASPGVEPVAEGVE